MWIIYTKSLCTSLTHIDQSLLYCPIPGCIHSGTQTKGSLHRHINDSCNQFIEICGFWSVLAERCGQLQ